MAELSVIYLSSSELTPYENNAKRHEVHDLEAIKASIRELGGFNDPIGIWGPDNIIVEGHGRQIAALELGLERVPCIRLDHLTDEQRRAYALAHNKTQELADYDFTTLESELKSLEMSFDMTDFGFDALDDGESDDADGGPDGWQGDDLPSRLGHNCFENFDRDFWPDYTGEYGIPAMEQSTATGSDFLRFCDWRGTDDYGRYIAHFFYDDFKFINAWRDPDCYVERLRQFKAVVAPDFSLYTDMPKVLQILSAYRRQWVGAYWQSLGLDVIPDVSWGDKSTFAWCFDGVPHGGTVAVSSVGVRNDPMWNGKQGTIFLDGWNEMMRVIQPETVLYYGDMIDGIEGNIIRIPSFYAEIRDDLNERKRLKNNGKR